MKQHPILFITEIAAGNQIIADFMEIPKCDRCEGCGNYKFGVGIYSSPEEMLYKVSWEWLMPVVKKIQQLKIEEWSKKKSVMNALMDVDIEILYQSVVVFIQYYNSLTPPKV